MKFTMLEGYGLYSTDQSAYFLFLIFDDYNIATDNLKTKQELVPKSRCPSKKVANSFFRILDLGRRINKLGKTDDTTSKPNVHPET